MNTCKINDNDTWGSWSGWIGCEKTLIFDTDEAYITIYNGQQTEKFNVIEALEPYYTSEGSCVYRLICCEDSFVYYDSFCSIYIIYHANHKKEIHIEYDHLKQYYQAILQ